MKKPLLAAAGLAGACAACCAIPLAIPLLGGLSAAGLLGWAGGEAWLPWAAPWLLGLRLRCWQRAGGARRRRLAASTRPAAVAKQAVRRPALDLAATADPNLAAPSTSIGAPHAQDLRDPHLGPHPQGHRR